MVFWLSIMAACGGYFTFLMGAKFENYYSIKHTQKLERVIYDLHTEKEQFEAANKELLTKKLALPVAQAEIKKLSLANEKLQSQVKKLSLVLVLIPLALSWRGFDHRYHDSQFHDCVSKSFPEFLDYF